MSAKDFHYFVDAMNRLLDSTDFKQLIYCCKYLQSCHEDLRKSYKRINPFGYDILVKLREATGQPTNPYYNKDYDQLVQQTSIDITDICALSNSGLKKADSDHE